MLHQALELIFFRHNLFTPFSKENMNMSGTGIDFSLARRFVEAVKGSLEVKSQIGKGSHVFVKLPMPVSDSRAWERTGDLDDVNVRVVALAHLRVSVRGFSTANADSSDVGNSNMFNDQTLMEQVCEQWLKMQVVDIDRNGGFVSDLILCDASYLSSLDYHARTKLSSPIIVVCHTAAASHDLEESIKSTHCGIFNFISPP
jgi:hypothetical protein